MRNHSSALIAAAVLFGLVADLTGQSPRGRPVFAGAGPVESVWAALTFEVGVSAATLDQLRPHFQAAWWEQARAQRESAGDFSQLEERMRKIRDELHGTLKTVLAAEELRRLADYQARVPPGGPPPGRFAAGRRVRGPGRGGSSASASPPLAKDDAERRILDAAERVTPFASVPIADARALRLLAEAIAARHAVEIGTSTGYSGLWLASALRRTGGRLTTFEIDAERAATARENFRRAGVDDIVTVIVGDAHETISRLNGPIDMVFIDADKEGYLDYLEKTLPLVRPGGLILAHNVNMGMASDAYVKRVTSDPALETIFYMEGAGLSITLRKR